MSATDSAPVKDRKSTLLDMPLVIVRIILEELHQYNPNSLLNFRLVSKTCQRESEFLLFQNLIIHDKTSIAKDINPIILDRLQNTEDALAERVRHLQFGPFVDGKYFLTVVSPVLAKTIRNLGDLQSLSWNNHLPIPLDALETFHEACSTAQLKITNLDRNFTPLDQYILSSPQLYSLDITFYHMFDETLTHGHSELQILKDCIMAGNSLKILHLYFKAAHPEGKAYSPDDFGYKFKDWDGVVEGPMNFHWLDSDRFPALEDLQIDYDRFYLTRDQCDMWVQCMDWSKLRRLDVEEGVPPHLFKALTGKVPQLKSLAFGTWPVYVPVDWEWHCLDSSIIERFLGGILALEHINFEGHDFLEFTETLPIILKQQGSSLKKLSLRCHASNTITWWGEEYNELLSKAPNLLFFNADMLRQTVSGHWAESGLMLTPQDKFDSLVWVYKDLSNGAEERELAM